MTVDEQLSVEQILQLLPELSTDDLIRVLRAAKAKIELLLEDAKMTPQLRDLLGLAIAEAERVIDEADR